MPSALSRRRRWKDRSKGTDGPFFQREAQLGEQRLQAASGTITGKGNAGSVCPVPAGSLPDGHHRRRGRSIAGNDAAAVGGQGGAATTGRGIKKSGAERTFPRTAIPVRPTPCAR